jgi:IS5 family transposase
MLQHRYEGLDGNSDPLVAILAAAPFELFRLELKRRW